MGETHIQAHTLPRQSTAMCTPTTVTNSFTTINQELIITPFFHSSRSFFQSIRSILPSISHQDTLIPRSLRFTIHLSLSTALCSAGGKHRKYSLLMAALWAFPLFLNLSYQSCISTRSEPVRSKLKCKNDCSMYVHGGAQVPPSQRQTVRSPV